MTAIPGVRLTGVAVPTDTADTYAVTDEQYNLGGFRTVADATARTGIPAGRRKIGMRVLQADTGEYWTLSGGVADENWIRYGIIVVASLPGADVTYRSVVAILQSASGTPDYIYVCMKNTANAYTWVKIFDGDSNVIIHQAVGL
jgi:hypothetical protein